MPPPSLRHTVHHATRWSRSRLGNMSPSLSATDCPPCYTLVQEAVDAHRAKLGQLSALIRNVTDNPSRPDDREFEDRLEDIMLSTRQLFEAAEAATSQERSPLEILGDLEVSSAAAL